MREYIVGFTDDADMERFERLQGTNGELIRCKDCKWFTGESHSCYSNGGTWLENEYCSAAERKED